MEKNESYFTYLQLGQSLQKRRWKRGEKRKRERCPQNERQHHHEKIGMMMTFLRVFFKFAKSMGKMDGVWTGIGNLAHNLEYQCQEKGKGQK